VAGESRAGVSEACPDVKRLIGASVAKLAAILNEKGQQPPDPHSQGTRFPGFVNSVENFFSNPVGHRNEMSDVCRSGNDGI
jgi:hypothetical protein